MRPFEAERRGSSLPCLPLNQCALWLAPHLPDSVPLRAYPLNPHLRHLRMPRVTPPCLRKLRRQEASSHSFRSLVTAWFGKARKKAGGTAACPDEPKEPGLGRLGSAIATAIMLAIGRRVSWQGQRQAQKAAGKGKAVARPLITRASSSAGEAAGEEQEATGSDNGQEAAQQAENAMGNEGAQEKWITGMTPNSAIIRAASIAGVVAVGRVAGAAGEQFAAMLHVTAYGALLGSILFQTFVVGLVLYKNVTREVFRQVQGVLFPPYFALNAGSLAAVMATGAALGAGNGALLPLGVGMGAVMANMFYLEPRTSETMWERARAEEQGGDQERVKALGKRFSKLHGASSALNLVTLVTALAHGWWIVGRFSPLPV